VPTAILYAYLFVLQKFFRMPVINFAILKRPTSQKSEEVPGFFMKSNLLISLRFQSLIQILGLFGESNMIGQLVLLHMALFLKIPFLYLIGRRVVVMIMLKLVQKTVFIRESGALF
jgi:hypothetical protein